MDSARPLGRNSVYCTCLVPRASPPDDRPLPNTSVLGPRRWRTKSRQGRKQPCAVSPPSSLPGLSSSPAANPALKCWAIFGRPCGTEPTRTDRCQKLRCGRALSRNDAVGARPSGRRDVRSVWGGRIFGRSFFLTKWCVAVRVRVAWSGGCGRAYLRPEGRAPGALTEWLRLSGAPNELAGCPDARIVRTPMARSTVGSEPGFSAISLRRF